MTDQATLDAIRERYQKALDAKPSKGDYTPAGIDAITDSVCDIPILLAEVDRLRTLKHRHEQTITELAARAEAAEQAVQRVRDLAAIGSLWSTAARRILRALDGGES